MSSNIFGERNSGYQVGVNYGTICLSPAQDNSAKSGIEITEKHRAFLAKLFITDPEEDLSKLKRRKGNRTPGTCSWFLDSEELLYWFRRAKPVSDIVKNVLWVNGSPGIGKSTMTMALVEELPKKSYFSNEDSFLSFFLCDANSEHQRTATSILRGLLYQIVKQCPPLIEHMMSKYEVQGERFFTSFDALWAALLDIGRVSKGAEIYCIVDALDECEAGSQDILLQQIRQSFGEARETSLVPHNVHLIIVSRPYLEIKDCLSIFTCIDLGSYKEVTNDLRTMIQDKVQDLAKRKNYSESVVQEVSQVLEEKADGTFLWVGIACEELKRVQSRKAVETLRARPHGLHALYQTLLRAAIEASSPNDYEPMKMILVIVTFALRPLTAAEISEACRLYLDKDISSRLQFTREIIDLCRLLIVVDNGYVRLLHRSVQDFLMAEMREIEAAKSNYELSCRCIDLVFQYCRPGMDKSALEPSYGFLGYSVLYWAQHANLAQTEFVVQEEHEQFFRNALGTWRCWLDNYNYLKRGSWGILEIDVSPIHVAARWGIGPLMLTLEERLEDKDARGQSPLLIAAENTQFEAMRALVQSGARLDSLNNEHQNVLHVAGQNGHFNDYAMIEFLLEKGASPYTCDEDNMTPFLYAIGDRHAELAQTFLRNGLDLEFGVRRRSWPGRKTVSSLPYGMIEPQEKTIESGLTALHFAALNACTEMTALLLKCGADPNASSDFGDTALHLGIRRRLLGRRNDDVWEIGRYAVESLADLITDHNGSEASDIYRAISDARIRIVEILLESESINANMANSYGDYPQHVIDFREASALSILDKLVAKGADTSQLNRARQTCLHLASKAGNLEVVSKLVKEGHDITLQDADGLSPFHYAIFDGNLDVLQFISNTCDCILSEAWHSLDHFGKSPLHHHVSSVFCSAEVVSLLVQLGCDVNQSDTEGNSPLGLYVGSLHRSLQKDVFWLIVQKGADPLWRNKHGQNLAHLLMRYRGADTAILDYLFNMGLNPAARDIDGKTFLHHGATHGAFTMELLEFLDSKGLLDLYTKDQALKTPLHYAEEQADRNSSQRWFIFQGQQWEESFKNLNRVVLSRDDNPLPP